NNTLDRSIYMSDYGVSTMRDATGDYLDADGSSGSLLFWDPRYSPNGAYGLTVNSYGGVVALESDNNRIVLNSELSSNIESRNNVINITPHSQQTSRGFRFTKSTDYLDGYLVFGDVNQRGLRFNRSTSGLVQVVDANFKTGGDTAIEAGNGLFNEVNRRSDNTPAYWNGTSTGTIDDVSNNSSTQLLATSMVTIKGDRDMFLGTRGGGILRVTNEKGYNSGGGITYRDVRASGYYGEFLETTATNMYVRARGEVRFTRNGTTGTYIPIRFSEWTATSHEKYKHDIDEWNYNVL